MNRLTKKILPEYGMHYEANGDVSVCQFNNKLGQLEDIEEKHSVLSLDDLDNKLAALEIIKEHKLLNYVLKNKKCANMYHLSKEECDLLKEALK